MSFFDAIGIAASGLTAERVRMDVTSENLANADTTVGANGGPYQRQMVVLEQAGGTFASTLQTVLGQGAIPGQTSPRGVQVGAIVNDASPPQLVYDPGNPMANKQGYVRMPNVQPVTEMVDLINESNSYQQDITAMNTAKSMYSSTLTLLH